MKQILHPKRGNISQKWELLLPRNQSDSGKPARSQNYVHNISKTCLPTTFVPLYECTLASVSVSALISLVVIKLHC